MLLLKNNYNKIKIILDLYRVYRHGTGVFSLELINENFINIAYLDKNDISLKINKNKNDISFNLGKITTNEGAISSNLSKIGNNENNISSNLSKIDTNKSNIDEIKSNSSNIDFNSNNKYLIENFFNYNIEIENSYKINKDNPTFSIFKYTLEDDFKKDGVLEIDCRLLYQYTTYNNIGFLQHIF